MRILLSIMTLCLCVFFSTEAGADYFHHSTNLVNKIKPNLTVRSKPTSVFSQTNLNPIKLASVQFLTDGTELKFENKKGDVKSQCAALGYVLPVSQCDASKGYVPSYLCSSELKEVSGADKYTSGCCNSLIYTADSENGCEDNSTATGDYCYWGEKKRYRCICDNIRYPYREYADKDLNSKEGMPCGQGDFDDTDVCIIKDAGGAVISKHYAGCCLRYAENENGNNGGYHECNASNHEVGWGKSCRINNGATLLYEKCVCSSNYQTPCSYSMLIESDDYCKYGNELYTRESNCESKCTQTAETNIDDYLYNSVWHCLYKEAGATIKTEESSVCHGLDETQEIVNNHYLTCEKQGYGNSIGDCKNSNLIIKCPTNSNKVWCLEKEYCADAPVGSKNGVDTCYTTFTHKPGKTMGCGSHNERDGWRCRYKNPDCNSCWEEGKYNPNIAGCMPTEVGKGDTPEDIAKSEDKLVRGEGGVCCNLGYRYEDGVCKRVECDGLKDDNGKLRFPYTEEPPSFAGELEVCYQGNHDKFIDNANSFITYYGYKRCYDVSSEGGIWSADANNPHACVCNKTDKERGYLAFGSELFFETNSTTPAGFNQGAYGVQNSCTDSTGSYYGYQSCYIGTILGKKENNHYGMCFSNNTIYEGETYGSVSYTAAYPYHQSYAQTHDYLKNILKEVADKDSTNLSAEFMTKVNNTSRFSVSNPITNRLPDESKVYCINKYTHCYDKSSCKMENGVEICTKQIGTDEVCALTKTNYPYDGYECENGYDSGCTRCYSIYNLKNTKLSDEEINNGAKYELHRKFLLKNESYSNGSSIEWGFEECPSGYDVFASGYGGCAKHCSLTKLDDCRVGDILQDGEINLGVVYFRDTTDKKLYIMGIQTTTTPCNYSTALTRVNNHEPAVGYSGNACFIKNHWKMPTDTDIGAAKIAEATVWLLNTTYRYLQKTNVSASAWTQSSPYEGSGTRYVRNCCSTTTQASESSSSTYRALPIAVINYATGACESED